MAVAEEVDKLTSIGVIREVNYPDWLANIMLVKKVSGKWLMCIDFIDLNKACPKDSYLLFWIDQLIDVIIGYELLTFMDVFFEYNQIHIVPENEEKIAIIIDHSLFCYRMCHLAWKMWGQPTSG